MKNIIIRLIYDVLMLDDNINISEATELANIPFDSLSFVKLIVELERIYNIEFEDDKLLFSEFPTIKSLIDYVIIKSNSNYR